MINVIGLGNAGCEIAERFSQYPQYEVYKIDISLKKQKNCFSMPSRKIVEEYESKFPARILTALRKIQGDILFIVGGGGEVSSASLRILEAVSKNKIEVLYVKPDESIVTDDESILDKISSGILQQYARSGLFERLYLVSNSEIQRTVGNIPISKYYDTLNEIISSTIHMVNVYRNSKPTISSFPKDSDVCRICTIGIGEIEKMTDQMYFSLDNANEKRYYFAINKKELEESTTLLSKIKTRARQKDSNIKGGFGIYPTEYKKSYIYIVEQTKIIQGENHG